MRTGDASAAGERTWTLLPRPHLDLVDAERDPRYFWLRHVPVVVAFVLCTHLPFVRRWTGLVPEICAAALAIHLLAFGAHVHSRIVDKIGPTAYGTLILTINFGVFTAICASPGRFFVLAWLVYFLYLPIPALAIPRSVYVAVMAMSSPFLAAIAWDGLGTSKLSDSLVLVAIVSILAGLAYVFFTSYAAVFRRERALLEKARLANAREEQKLAIADDLHDTLGIALAEVALWQSIGRGTGGGDAQAVAFERAEKRLEDAIHELRATVATLSDKPISCEAVEYLMRGRLGSICEAAGVILAFERAGEGGEIDAAEAHEIVKIAEEAASNAIKHGKPKGLRVRLSWEDGLRLSITDDGRGFDPATIREGHGFSSLRRRARQLGGRLDIQSRIGEGTTVELHAAKS